MTKTEINAILMRIEIRMAELGMAKEDFYAQSKISSASYSQWNTGTHKPTKKKLADAARVLGVSLEYLLTGEKENKPTPEGEPMSLEALRSLSKEELYELMNNVVKALKEKE